MAFKLKYTHQFIIVWLSLSAFLHNILMNGANNVILSSLQKEFFLSSKETGIYVSVYDIGSLISSILVSFASARGSKPRWISFGMCALFLGCMIVIVPHFIKPNTSQTQTDQFSLSKNSSFSLQDDNSIEMCNYSITTDFTTNTQVKYFRPQPSNITNARTNKRGVFRSADSDSFWSKIQMKHILYFGNMINGFSSASLTTITFAYIEDVAPHKLSAIYESVYYAVGAFGVGVGFMITSKFLTFHTDLNQDTQLPSWLKPSHPNWIGAWWLPFLLFGFISLILAVVIFTFPKKLNHDEDEVVEEKKNGTLKLENELVSLKENKNENELQVNEVVLTRHYEDPVLETLERTGSLLSVDKLGNRSSRLDLNTEEIVSDSLMNEQKSKYDLVKKSLSLLIKPLYLLIIIATTIEGLLQNSFLAFASLFLEYQYRLASGTASFILGLLSIPPLIVGGILSGIIVKRLKYNTSHCCKFLAVVLFVNILVYSGFMIYCKEPNMIPNAVQLSNNLYDPSTNYTLSENCNCNRKIFKPVCLKNSDDIFFQSACLAGCSEFDKNTDIYSNCTQEMATFVSLNETSAEQVNYFINGLCPTSGCTFRLVVSYMCIFFLMLLNALTFLPYLKVTIGSIDNKEMNPIGLGLKQFFMNGFGKLILFIF